MTQFKISIIKGNIVVLCDDWIPETDIEELLSFEESQIEELYKNHAATQARWEQVAINLKNSFDLFKEEFVSKWWAHNKRYARLVLEGYGEKKPTIDAVNDQVILTYSEDTSELSLEKYISIAYDVAIKKDKALDREGFEVDFKKFLLTEPKWTYESILRSTKQMEKGVLSIQNIAKRLDNRSYHMRDLKDLLMAKKFNIGPVSETESFNIMSKYRR